MFDGCSNTCARRNICKVTYTHRERNSNTLLPSSSRVLEGLTPEEVGRFDCWNRIGWKNYFTLLLSELRCIANLKGDFSIYSFLCWVQFFVLAVLKCYSSLTKEEEEMKGDLD